MATTLNIKKILIFFPTSLLSQKHVKWEMWFSIFWLVNKEIFQPFPVIRNNYRCKNDNKFVCICDKVYINKV